MQINQINITPSVSPLTAPTSTPPNAGPQCSEAHPFAKLLSAHREPAPTPAKPSSPEDGAAAKASHDDAESAEPTPPDDGAPASPAVGRGTARAHVRAPHAPRHVTAQPRGERTADSAEQAKDGTVTRGDKDHSDTGAVPPAIAALMRGVQPAADAGTDAPADPSFAQGRGRAAGSDTASALTASTQAAQEAQAQQRVNERFEAAAGERGKDDFANLAAAIADQNEASQRTSDITDPLHAMADKERIEPRSIDLTAAREVHGAVAPAPLDAGAGAAPATATLAVSTPVNAPAFREALGVQVSVLARDGVHHAELHLNPADMGPISVQIALDGTQAQVDFGAASSATRQIIESGLPELAAALRDAGFTLTGGGVSQHPRGHADDAGQGARGSSRRIESAGDATSGSVRRANVRVPLGAVDLYA